LESNFEFLESESASDTQNIDAHKNQFSTPDEKNISVVFSCTRCVLAVWRKKSAAPATLFFSVWNEHALLTHRQKYYSISKNISTRNDASNKKFNDFARERVKKKEWPAMCELPRIILPSIFGSSPTKNRYPGKSDN